MRLLSAVLVIGTVAGTAARALSVAPVPALVPAPIVVAELFTSEGCSSCPPADALLGQLTADAASGATILTLSEHVDYWDQLGWHDPFSSAAFSRRQSDYAARAFRSERIYTPQIVIDGHLETIGSDAASVRSLVARAARDPKAMVNVTASRQEDGAVLAVVQIDASAARLPRGDAGVVVAVVQDHLQNDVTRGENQGRTLSHSAVVRALASAGTFRAKSATFEGAARVPWQTGWKAADVRVIAFVQDSRTMRIFGAGSAGLH